MVEILRFAFPFTFVSAIVTGRYVPEERILEIMRYTKEKCITESGVRKDNIILIMDHDEPLTEEGKCLISCLLQEMDIVDSIGKVNDMEKVAFVTFLKNGKKTKWMYDGKVNMAKICRNQVKIGEKCHTALNYHQRLKNTGQELMFFCIYDQWRNYYGSTPKMKHTRKMAPKHLKRGPKVSRQRVESKLGFCERHCL